MGSTNSAAKEINQTLRIWEVNKDRLESLHHKLSNTPKLLSQSAGSISCCIFRVPQTLIDINGKSYQPHVVSIGPYHHDEPHLEMIQEHKWRFLGSLLDRTRIKSLLLEDYLKAVQKIEIETRECYSETIHLNTDEFIEMMVLDGCFVIELFRKFGGVVPCEPSDPLISMSWVYSFLARDLIRIENQIPFFVLQCLFDLTKMPEDESGPSLSTLVMYFFNYVLQRKDEVVAKHSNHQGKHLLDFLRGSFIPPDHEELTQGRIVPTHVIQTISKLRRAGIGLKPGNEESFLVVKFRHGVIEMPTISINDFMSTFLLNCVAYEQCHSRISKHITTYVTLLDYLINTAKDVEYLCDQNIVENYFGTNVEVAQFINNIGKDVAFNINTCYLSGLFNDVNHYYKNGRHVQWASFRYTYFDTPWSFISAFAALILLVLTIAQTFYTIISYYHE